MNINELDIRTGWKNAHASNDDVYFYNLCRIPGPYQTKLIFSDKL